MAQATAGTPAEKPRGKVTFKGVAILVAYGAIGFAYYGFKPQQQSSTQQHPWHVFTDMFDADDMESLLGMVRDSHFRSTTAAYTPARF